MGIPPIRLQDEIPPEVLDQVTRVLKSGMWIDNKNVQALEQEFAEFTGARYCRAVSNGTAALLCALFAIDVQPGDEVIVPSFSFIATANVVRLFKAQPVFVDVGPDFNIDADKVQARITPKTRAIMPVHLFGLPADMDAINAIARDHDVRVVEDACQAHGAEYKGTRTGNLGDVAGFSLYPTKNMYCGGEGGLVTTSDERIYERVKLFANHGRSARYAHVAEGYNFRMQEVNAVVARYSLAQLPDHNATRQKWAGEYDEALQGVPDIQVPIVPAHKTHVYHQYTIRSRRRDALAARLKEAGIGFGIYYETPIHRQECYQEGAGETPPDLPVTDQVATEVLSLPVHHNLEAREIHEVIEVVTRE